MKLKLWEKAILLSLVLTVLVSMVGFQHQCEDISQRVLRLHVLANSDSEEDQALKLKVRDRILEEGKALFSSTADLQQAEQIAAQNLDRIQAAAQDEVYRQGYDYPVNVELADMYFTTREYDTVTLPAGTYNALRVTIGSGAGKNWWCVLFPPMCVAAATEEVQLETVLTDEQLDIVEESQQYEVQFKVVEWFENLCQWIRSW